MVLLWLMQNIIFICFMWLHTTVQRNPEHVILGDNVTINLTCFTGDN